MTTKRVKRSAPRRRQPAPLSPKGNAALQEAHAALRESEERFRLFMDHSPTAIWVKDEQGRYVFLNQTYERLLHVRLAEWRGKSDAELWPAETAEQFRRNDRAVLDQGQLVETTETAITPEGHLTHWLICKFPFQDVAGQRYVAGMGLDITAQKRTEEALRESEERYRVLFEQSADAITLIDAETLAFVDFNEEACRRLGYTREEFARLKLRDVEARESNQEQLERSRQVMAAGMAVFETHHRTKAGAVMDVEVRAKAVRVGGRLLFQSIWRDVTEPRQAAARLRASEARWRFALQAADMGAWELDLRTNQAWRSLRHGEIFGYQEPLPEWTYALFLQHVVAEDRSRVDQCYKQALKSGGNWDFECRIRRRDGAERWIEVHGLSAAARQSDCAFGVVRDITERKQTEAALRQLNVHLEQRVAERTAQVREGEQLLRTVINLVPHPIFAKDAAGRYLLANRATAEACGRQPEEMAGRLDRELLSEPEQWRQAQRDDLEVLQSGQPKVIAEEAITYPDQQVHFFRVTKIPFTPPGTDQPAVLGVALDITENLRFEQALRESEHQLRTLFETMTEGFCLHEIIFDAAGEACDARHLLVNPAFERLTGVPAADCLQRTARQVFPNIAPLWFERYGQVALTGEPAHFHGQLDPRGRWLEVSANRTQSGRCAVVFSDVTVRKQAEMLLLEAHELNQQIVATAREGIVVHDRDGNHLIWNPFMEELTGVAATKVRGQRPTEAFPFLRELGFDAMFRRALAGESLTIPDIYYEGPVRTAWLRLALGPLRNVEGHSTGVIATVHDMTEQKELERQLLSISEHEQQRIGQDLHDGVSQQVTAALFLTNTLRHQLAASAHPEAAVAQRVEEMLAQLQKDLRQVARGLQPVAPTPEGLVVALRALATWVGEHYPTICQFRCSGRVLVADNQTASHLFRIAQEAVNNALRHAQPKHISITLSQQRRALVLQVRDDGPGFPPARSSKTGMGRRIMRSRSEAIGGQLVINPAKPQGTQVRCTVPQPPPVRNQRL